MLSSKLNNNKKKLKLSINFSPPIPTQTQIDIIRYTWEHLCSIRKDKDDPNMSPSRAFGSDFFDALYEKEPLLQYVFSDIVHQSRAFASMMSSLLYLPANVTVREINAEKRKGLPVLSFGDLVATVLKEGFEIEAEDRSTQFQAIGARHYLYNLSTYHLDMAYGAVLEALESRLEHDLLPEVKEAWEKTLQHAIFHMQLGLSSAYQNQGDVVRERQSCVIQ
ncbi:hypothetical protein BY458DRAFT_444201 [Sporodiniella umbellata]|nr:hypothetical protein BY458DRAFT_444201 [Sporodiniella umbellata]